MEEYIPEQDDTPVFDFPINLVREQIFPRGPIVAAGSVIGTFAPDAPDAAQATEDPPNNHISLANAQQMIANDEAILLGCALFWGANQNFTIDPQLLNAGQMVKIIFTKSLILGSRYMTISHGRVKSLRIKALVRNLMRRRMI